MSAERVTAEFLRGAPLPLHDEAGDKEDRGRVIVVGGSAQAPGAALLAGTAALRAGAGKLQVATVKSIAPHLAIALPEALVVGLEETAYGEIDPAAAELLATEPAAAGPCWSVPACWTKGRRAGSRRSSSALSTDRRSYWTPPR